MPAACVTGPSSLRIWCNFSPVFWCFQETFSGQRAVRIQSFGIHQVGNGIGWGVDHTWSSESKDHDMPKHKTPSVRQIVAIVGLGNDIVLDIHEQ